MFVGKVTDMVYSPQLLHSGKWLAISSARAGKYTDNEAETIVQ